MSRITRAIVLLLAALGAGCDRTPSSKPGPAPAGGDGEATLSVAEQYGLAYAPLQILRQPGFGDRLLPGIRVTWRQLGNTATIREAMVSGRVDVGFVAIPPFLIGRDNGMDWRIVAGLCEAPLALVSWKGEIRALSDIGPGERIALPQPASVQHILLAMAAERELGDARRFDRQIVTMAHPDAMAALLARGDVAAHFASPPYLGRELAEGGIHVVLTGSEAMGERFTFIVGVATEEVLGRSGPEIAALSRALAEVSTFLTEHPEEAAALLAPLYGMPVAELAAELDAQTAPASASAGLRFGPEILGLPRFAGFMHRHGFLTRPADPVERLLWEGAAAGQPGPSGPGGGSSGEQGP